MVGPVPVRFNVVICVAICRRPSPGSTGSPLWMAVGPKTLMLSVTLTAGISTVTTPEVLNVSRPAGGKTPTAGGVTQLWQSVLHVSPTGQTPCCPGGSHCSPELIVPFPQTAQLHGVAPAASVMISVSDRARL